jgi:protein SCO1
MSTITRRQWVAAFGGSVALGQSLCPCPVLASDRMRVVDPPAPAPEIELTDHLGRTRPLREMLAGHISVVQTMFTGCSTVCPIQGAVFAEVQRRLAHAATKQPVQLLSISIDPLNDSPSALKAWLERLQAQRHWSAGVPKMDAVARLQRGLDGPSGGPSGDPSGGPSGGRNNSTDGHSDRFYFFDPRARLVWRSAALPGVDEVLEVVRYLAAASRP